jgi:hypothetical protein
MRIYRIERMGRKFIKKLTEALVVGDITNFHIKGITTPRGKDERGELFYEVVKDNK